MKATIIIHIDPNKSPITWSLAVSTLTFERESNSSRIFLPIKEMLLLFVVPPLFWLIFELSAASVRGAWSFT